MPSLIPFLFGYSAITAAIASVYIEPWFPVDNLPLCPIEQTNESYFFPNPANCSTYYQCSNGHAIEQTCPPDLVFNPQVTSCDFQYNVNCTSLPSGMLFPVNCVPNAIMASPFDEHSFIYCQNDGLAIIVECPGDLVFNPDILVCDWDRNIRTFASIKRKK